MGPLRLHHQQVEGLDLGHLNFVSQLLLSPHCLLPPSHSKGLEMWWEVERPEEG